nr:uncharacterized protein LOC129271135 [Lytechinus pictus]
MTTTTSTSNMPRHTLRQTDFLPSRFSGDRLDRDDSTAHFLTFDDYLDAHNIDSTDPAQFQTILRSFRRTLQGQARLWIDGLTFNSYDDLKDGFVRRFSPAKSSYSHVRDFNTMTMTDGESAEAYLQRLRQTASYINYGEAQIKHRLLDSLPNECRATILMSASASDITSDEIAAKAQLFLDLRKDSTPQTKELTFSAQAEIDLLREEINSMKITDTPNNDRDRGRAPNRRSPTPRRNNLNRSSDRSFSQRRQELSRDQYRDYQYHDTRRGKSPYRHNRDFTDRRPRLTCDYCRIPGHVWRECRRRLRDMETQPRRDYGQRQQYYGQRTGYGQQQQDF